MIPSNSSVTESALGFRLWLQFQFVADIPSSCSLQVTAAAQAPAARAPADLSHHTDFSVFPPHSSGSRLLVLLILCCHYRPSTHVYLFGSQGETGGYESTLSLYLRFSGCEGSEGTEEPGGRRASSVQREAFAPGVETSSEALGGGSPASTLGRLSPASSPEGWELLLN